MLPSEREQLDLAMRCQRSGDLERAGSIYRMLLQSRPDDLGLRHRMGVLCLQRGDHAAAVGHLEQVVRGDSRAADTLAVLCLAYQGSGRLDEAVEAATASLAIKPGNAALLNVAGHLFQRLGEPARAVEHLREAVTVKTDFADAHHNLAIAYQSLGRIGEAVEHYRRAIALTPSVAQIHYNLALALQFAGSLPEAVASLRRCLDLAPDHLEALHKLVYFRRHLCDWEGLDAQYTRLEQLLRAHIEENGPAQIWPYALNLPPVPVDLHDAAAGYLSEQVSRRARSLRAPFPSAPAVGRDRLTVGYLSADFGAHAVGMLIYRLLEHHNRERIRTVAYSLKSAGDSFHSVVRDGCDEFCDLSALSARHAAGKIRADGVDILVDLGGYTLHARPEVVALRPAPIQVSWCGYLNTMRADFIDYIIADRTVIPPGREEARYSEAVVRLPHFFFPGSPLPRGGSSPSRPELGLPDDRFVFASFNNTYKIDSHAFAAWMQILKARPDSVLWLYAGSCPQTIGNLRRIARDHGVDPIRLIGAPPVPIQSHMARQCRADLFLDTFGYNAGATGVAAAQAGLPILACTGQRLLGRMTTSLNRVLGVGELNCDNARDYVATAVALAGDRAALSAIADRIRRSVADGPLFDIAACARAVEGAYAAMWQRHCAGAPPAGFDVS